MSESKEEIIGETKTGGWGSELWEILKVLLVSVAIVLPIRYFIAQPFIVRGASMEPNFENSEYLVIDEVSYYFRGPQRGEAIVFRYPRDPRQFFIKRVVGLPGEEIKIKEGRIRVYNFSYPEGFTLTEPYLDPPQRATNPDVSVKLGDGEFFVLGDNRDFSSDSRIWGSLPKNLVVGRVFFRVWPFAKLGVVPNYSVEY